MQVPLAGNIPDGALINGVANFYRTTKPLTRVDGSSLVVGDVWVNPSDYSQWFWNGTYWLGNPILSAIGQGVNTTASPINISSNIPPSIKYNLFIESCHWTGKTGSSNSPSNFRFLNLTSFNNNGANSTLLNNFANTSTFSAGTYFALNISLNYLITTDSSTYNNAASTISGVYVQDVASGAPGNIYSSIALIYRYAVK